MSNCTVEIIGRYEKLPGEVMDYYVDFNPWFDGKPPKSPAREDAPRAVAPVDVTADPGITVVDFGLSAGIVRIVLSGGIVGSTYGITVSMTTDAVPAIVKQAIFNVAVVSPT